MSFLAKRLFQSQSMTKQESTGREFYGREDLGEDGVEMRIFETNTLDEHLNLLKRVHLKVPHIPAMKIVGDFHNNIEICLKSYKLDFAHQISQYSHQQKVQCLINLVQSYISLIKQYGLFLVNESHIRFSHDQHYAIWIHDNYFCNHCSHPVETTEINQWHVVEHFIEILSQFFNKNFFKYRPILNFQDLINHLLFVDKRNKIHQRCKQIVRQKSKSKTKASVSVKNFRESDSPVKRRDLLEKPNHRLSSLMISNITRNSSAEKNKNQSCFNMGFSQVEISKGSGSSKQLRSEMDSTLETDMVGKKNISYFELGNIVKKTQKKSCVFGARESNVEKIIKRSNILSRKRSSPGKVNTHFCPFQDKRIHIQITTKPSPLEKLSSFSELKLEKKSSVEKKNSVEVSLNSLFLSQIIEDPENEVGGSDLKKKQHLKDIVEEFENFLFN